MTRTRNSLPAIARAGLVLALSSGVAALRAQEPDVRALFVSNCAQCHGETGDGQGTTQLDRPARSFKDGGFSYGNTPEALFRTISMGIPGTPMPGFDLALDEEKRRALADYVITLGPEIREVSEEDMVLVVRDRPLVVRGKLPPIAEGALEHPRGLLIGTTDGFTFEYQADDVRLLGVRQGDFVRRSDWVGRGGTELEPLGKVVYLVEHGTPASLFFDVIMLQGSIDSFADLPDEPERPLQACLTGTWTRAGHVGLTYKLVDPHGVALWNVSESVGAFGTSIGAGFRRHFQVTEVDPDSMSTLEFRLRPDPTSTRCEFENRGDWVWNLFQRQDGVVDCFGIRANVKLPFVVGAAPELAWPLTPRDGPLEVELATVLVSEWSAEKVAKALGEAEHK